MGTMEKAVRWATSVAVWRHGDLVSLRCRAVRPWSSFLDALVLCVGSGRRELFGMAISSEERRTSWTSIRLVVLRFGDPCSQTGLVAVSGLILQAKALCRRSCVPSSSLEAPSWASHTPDYPKYYLGQSHRSFFRLDKGVVFDVATSLEAPS
jgi:hypothetical protein